MRKDDANRYEDQMYTIPVKVLNQIMNEIITIKQDYNKRINELNSMIEKQQREYSQNYYQKFTTKYQFKN